MSALVVYALVDGYHTCFVRWAKDPHLPVFFGADYVEIGKEINALPDETPKFVVVEAKGMLARGAPVPTQTVMFSHGYVFRRESRKEESLLYIAARGTGDSSGQLHLDAERHSIRTLMADGVATQLIAYDNKLNRGL